MSWVTEKIFTTGFKDIVAVVFTSLAQVYTCARRPGSLKKSLTYDQGKEMSEHKLFTAGTQMQVYFCHPASPWERGTCENTNMLVRDYFPKGTDFRQVTTERLKEVEQQLNERPRKTLGWKPPADALHKLLAYG